MLGILSVPAPSRVAALTYHSRRQAQASKGQAKRTGAIFHLETHSRRRSSSSSSLGGIALSHRLFRSTYTHTHMCTLKHSYALQGLCVCTQTLAHTPCWVLGNMISERIFAQPAVGLLACLLGKIRELEGHRFRLLLKHVPYKITYYTFFV